MRTWCLALLALLVSLAPSACARTASFDDFEPVTVDSAQAIESLEPPEPATVPVPEEADVGRPCLQDEVVGRLCTDEYAEAEGYELEVPALAGEPPSDEATVEEPPQPAPADEAATAVPAPPGDVADEPAARAPETSTPLAPEPLPSPLPEPRAADPAPAVERQANPAPQAGALLPALLTGVAFALPGALALKGAWAWFLLRRQERQTCRAAVLDAIGSHPGIRHFELVALIARGNGTVEHHVRRLAKQGLVTRVRRAGTTCYFPEGAAPAQDMRLHMALSGRRSRQVALELARSPGLRLSDLAQRIGVRVSTAHYQVAKLEQAGALVREGPSGSALRLTPDAERWLAGTHPGPGPSPPSAAPAGGLRASVGSTA